MSRKPWQEWLTLREFQRMFPGGQADYDAYWDRVEAADDPDYAQYYEFWKLRQAARLREGPEEEFPPAVVTKDGRMRDVNTRAAAFRTR